MSITDVLDIFSKLGSRSKVHDDDYIDQLNHFVTPTLLLITASATYLKQYLGDPIHCWVPAEYDKDHFQEYVDHWCFISDLYNVPMSNQLPKDVEDRDENLVSFYRWVSILLLFQALMFKLPNLIWISWKGFSGLDPDRILKMVEEIEIGEEMEEHEEEKPDPSAPEQNGQDIRSIDDMPPKKKKIQLNKNKGSKKEHQMTSLARFIDRRLSLTSRRGFVTRGFQRINCTKNSGNFVTMFFIFSKILYVVVILSQFFLLSAFLDMDFFGYGTDIVQLSAQWRNWEDLDVFPRVAMCDLQIRQLQNVQRFTVQCVLSMNIFIEKIYALQWFWFVFLLIFTCIGVIKACASRLSFDARVQFVRKFLTIGFNGYMWPPPKSSKPLTSTEDENTKQKDVIEVTPRDIIQRLSDEERHRVIRLVQEKAFIRQFVEEYLKADGIFMLMKLHETTSPGATEEIVFRLLEYYLVSKGHVGLSADSL